MYNTIYKTIPKNFREYFWTLEFDEVEGLNNNIKSNCWAFETIQEYDSSFELMKSFDIFYYLNGRFPYTNGLLWVPNDDKPNIISGEKLSLKRLYKLFCGTHPRGLVSMQFLATLNLFLSGKEVIS